MTNIYKLSDYVAPQRVDSKLSYVYIPELNLRMFNDPDEYIKEGLCLDVSKVSIDVFADGFEVYSTITDSSSNTPDILMSKLITCFDEATDLATQMAELLLEHYPWMKEEINRKCNALKHTQFNVGERLTMNFKSGFSQTHKIMG